MAKIIVVDDEERIRTILQIMLSSKGHTVYEAESGTAALQILQDESADLVISDIRMDNMGGIELLAAIKKMGLGCPVVFITAFATLESSVEALRLGAVDYLVKPFEEKSVLLAVERALGMGRILSENVRLKSELQKNKEHGGVFVSPAMCIVRDMALKVAKGGATVLLSGESGTGKEVVANMIHQASARCKGPFVVVNCGAISPTLIESELFGHEKGAFTGAAKVRAGKFETASKGTLFLDEIGELSLEAQVKLLRVIQEKKVQRLGSDTEKNVDIRLLCATNRNLEEMVAQGIFRQDLYYRVAVFPIVIPPLRERKEAIDDLVRYFVQRLTKIDGAEVLTPAASRLLSLYGWPGNIRELANAVERAMILKDNCLPLVSDDFIFLKMQQASVVVGDNFSLPAEGVQFDDLRRSVVEQALNRTDGNQSAAARLLGMTRAKFRTLLTLVD